MGDGGVRDGGFVCWCNVSDLSESSLTVGATKRSEPLLVVRDPKNHRPPYFTLSNLETSPTRLCKVW